MEGVIVARLPRVRRVSYRSVGGRFPRASLRRTGRAAVVEGSPADLEALIPDALDPQLETIGALPIDQHMSSGRRGELAADLTIFSRLQRIFL